ncbi:hypothetical protein HAX54_045974, partial [Datura stramonium]|nr:hypothetical protein [Datura stramonium]
YTQPYEHHGIPVCALILYCLPGCSPRAQATHIQVLIHTNSLVRMLTSDTSLSSQGEHYALSLGRCTSGGEDDNDDPGGDGTGLAVMQELLGPMVPQLSPRDVLDYSFLDGGENEEASDPGNDSNEVSS